MDRKVKFDEIEQEYEAFKEVYEPDWHLCAVHLRSPCVIKY